ncbi:MAG: peptidoglycan DD-metalloendopeptidase family protein [Xanthomonadaceae bacterium]|nr:peptidoglycan DD-metalloendopeptidase family protein [Xanthomonadaceae bacterium]
MIWFLVSAFIFEVSASPVPTSLSNKLHSTQYERLRVEQDLLDSMKDEKHAKSRIVNLRKLIKLQKAERSFIELRQGELETLISDLVVRKSNLQTKINKKQVSLRTHLKDLAHASRESSAEQQNPLEKERYESAKTKIVSKLVDRGIRDIESLKADWQDVETLDQKIQKEREELAILVQDFAEREGTLKLNQKIETEMLKRHHAQSAERLTQYQRLKEREVEVESLIAQFNARQELEKAEEDLVVTDFARMKGKLALPINGKLAQAYGQGWDDSLQMNVFKKGVEIEVGQAALDVRSIYTGKVAFSGELPNLGQVVIIDHGGHYFSLCGKLGARSKKEGDAVGPGDIIGKTGTMGQSLYFEIRSRNVPLNPLQWVNPSSKVEV